MPKEGPPSAHRNHDLKEGGTQTIECDRFVSTPVHGGRATVRGRRAHAAHAMHGPQVRFYIAGDVQDGDLALQRLARGKKGLAPYFRHFAAYQAAPQVAMMPVATLTGNVELW